MNDGQLTFSQLHGYDELPEQLKLEAFPLEARRRIWNVLYSFLERSMDRTITGRLSVGNPWGVIIRDTYAVFYSLPLDDWTPDFRSVCGALRGKIETEPFHRVFDLIQFVLRHDRCPTPFVASMKRTFTDCRLAYAIDDEPPPSILPIATEEEGKALVNALQTLRQAGQNASAAHLGKSGECMNRGDWAGSVRESIHAVESTARQLDPEASKTLGPALKSLERNKPLHPTLKAAFGTLYGYTSEEEGIRHALLSQSDAPVGQNEAVFMLSACAAFSSYLCRAAEDLGTKDA